MEEARFMKVVFVVLVLALTTVAAAQAQPVSGFYVQGSAGLALPQQTSVSQSPPPQSSSSAAAAANAAINSDPGTSQSGSAGWGFGNGLRMEVQGFHSAQSAGTGN
jgi:hypothetical protein